jgi:phosphatidylglycerophosphatase A
MHCGCGKGRRMSSAGRGLILFCATGCGSGYAPVAPGTAGTAVGIVIFFLLSSFSLPLYLLTTLAFTFAAIWCAHQAALILQMKDPSLVVIDEIAGYLVTMASFPFTWQYVAAGFVLFRLFDIVKPFPARWIDRTVEGGYGIVLDDVAAGIYANIVLQVFRLML